MGLAPTRWLGYKKELTLFCNARLLSCPRVARDDRIEFVILKP